MISGKLFLMDGLKISFKKAIFAIKILRGQFILVAKTLMHCSLTLIEQYEN
jgi:hypothetical protein